MNDKVREGLLGLTTLTSFCVFAFWLSCLLGIRPTEVQVATAICGVVFCIFSANFLNLD